MLARWYKFVHVKVECSRVYASTMPTSVVKNFEKFKKLKQLLLIFLHYHTLNST